MLGSHRDSRIVATPIAAALASILLVGAAAANDAPYAAGANSGVHHAPLSAKSAKEARGTRPYKTARRYVVRFYPRWFTYRQFTISNRLNNHLVGPFRMTPEWGSIVAPNDDTLYTSGQLDLSKSPLILTIPKTTDSYSVLVIDVYGTVIDTGIDSAGTYALVGPGFHGRLHLPKSVTRIHMPHDAEIMAIRADRYAPDGTNMIREARKFRRNLRLAPLADYRQDHASGRTLIVPVSFYAPRFKVQADEELSQAPTAFLKQTQKAMRDPLTRPLTHADRRLIARFNRYFRTANSTTRSRMILGAQAAHTQIVDNWLSHVDSNNWVHFGNIGQWGTDYLDRASTTQFLQVGNGPTIAGYYDAFVDGNGINLDAGVTPAYVLTIPKKLIPDAKRFWSLTAYTPESITLVDNPIDKYVVGSYTPGLQYNSDGGVSIYMQSSAPTTIPQANWLPVPDGQFNVLLRVYGPEGNTAPGEHYVPPAITPTFTH